jgi:hypothetical protein
MKSQLPDIEIPVQNKWDAIDVTQLNYVIEPVEEKGWVNLDAIRIADFRHALLELLQVENNKLDRPLRSSRKLLFSGHRGCGKTIELKRLSNELDHRDGYNVILIQMERSIPISTFKSEDFFILIITHFAAKLEKLKIKSKLLEKLEKEWLQEKEIIEEVKDSYRADVASEAEVKLGFLGFAKLQSKLMALMSFNSSTAKILRQKVSANPLELNARFNEILQKARAELAVKADAAKDFLFIIDGYEKAPLSTYRTLFYDNPFLIHTLDINALVSIPIDSYYSIAEAPSDIFSFKKTLPMVQIDDENKGRFGDIIRKRLDEETFFEPEVLDYCVEMSGGCPRQLLQIVNHCLVHKDKARITRSVAEATCLALGQQLSDLLTNEHKEVLNSGQYNPANKLEREMLARLALLKYNGHFKINPILNRSEFLDG